MTNKFTAVNLLLSDSRGVYIPRDFVTGFDMEKWQGISEDAVIECSDIDNDFYWDAWIDILDHAFYVDSDGNKFTLYQDGDLWAICYEKMTSEEKHNFGFDE